MSAIDLDEITLDAVLNSLTADTPKGQPVTVDEMSHTGGAGVSFVQRWYLNPSPQARNTLCVWRIMWSQTRRGERVRIAYGVSASLGLATEDGRREARRLAKDRRAAA